MAGSHDGLSYGTPALKVRGKVLTRLKEDGESLVLFDVEQDERAALIETQPKLFYLTDHYRDWPMVLLSLPKAKPKTVESFLLRRWRVLPSRKALKAFDKTPDCK